MFRSIVMAACVAGLSAGIVLTLVQQPTVAPLILAAESYEAAAAPGQDRAATPAATITTAMFADQSVNAQAAEHAHSHAAGARRTHVHDDTAWSPENGFERTFWSLLTNVSAAIGFALLLCAVYTLLPSITPARGLLWGVAGFVVFFANPGIGLHPEIPGTMSADLFDRQLWWSFTAVCSAAAVALIAWRPAAWAWGAAAALLVLPHLIGAPQPEVRGSLAPQELVQQFIWATTFANAVFWVSLGVLSALAFRHLGVQPVAA